MAVSLTNPLIKAEGIMEEKPEIFKAAPDGFEESIKGQREEIILASYDVFIKRLTSNEDKWDEYYESVMKENPEKHKLYSQASPLWTTHRKGAPLVKEWIRHHLEKKERDATMQKEAKLISEALKKNKG